MSFLSGFVQNIKQGIGSLTDSEIDKEETPGKSVLSYISKTARTVENLGKGLVRGVGELATAPGYLADTITGGRFESNITPEQISSQKQQLAPIGRAQKVGHVVGSISPGIEAITPALEKTGVPSGLAFGVGLGIDVLTPGPGELKGSNVVKNVVKEGRPTIFEGFKDLSLKSLEWLRGKSITSKQEILDFANRPELKQVEKDLIKNTVNKFSGEKIPVQDFADNVKSELLPLSVKKLERAPFGASARTGIYGAPPEYATHEFVVLPSELRGPVADYAEHVYRSSINTTAGEQHYGRTSIEDYFGHTRIEDLPNQGYFDSLKALDTRDMTSAEHTNFIAGGKNGTTRRVIELQSDLFQKGRLEKSVKDAKGNLLSERFGYMDGLSTAEKDTAALLENKSYITPDKPTPPTPQEIKRWYGKLTPEESKYALETEYNNKLKDYEDGISSGKYATPQEEAQLEKLKKLGEYNIGKKSESGLTKLKQYNDPAAHFRMAREEIKQAAIDGKTKLQFPTGETAMKIEGLGESADWGIINGSDGALVRGGRLTPENMKVGMEVVPTSEAGDAHIITEVLGDGKFRSVFKDSIGTKLVDVKSPEGKSLIDNYIKKHGIDERSESYMRMGQSYPPLEELIIDGEKYVVTGSSPEVSAAYFVLNPVNLPKGKKLLDLISKLDENLLETFDISGRPDVNDPIYKFYQNDLGRFLKNKFNAQEIVDPQGIKWWQVDIKPETAKQPVLALGSAKIGTLLGLSAGTIGGLVVNKLLNRTNDTTVVSNNRVKQKPEAVTPKTIPLPPSTPENTVGDYNFAGYATAPDAMSLMNTIYNSTPDMITQEEVQKEINRVMSKKNIIFPPQSPITGEMIINSSIRYGIEPRILLTLLRKESSLGLNMLTENNPANIWNTDEGRKHVYPTMQDGIDAAAREISRRRVK